MYSSFFRVEDAVRTYVRNNDYNRALDEIRQFVIAVMNEQATPGEVIGSRKLDELCSYVGVEYSRFSKKAAIIEKRYVANDRKIVIICTGLYKYGGTSLVISDLIRAHPGRKATVLATNYLDDMSAEDLAASRIGNTDADVLICPRGDATYKLLWLIQKIINLPASRIFLLNHHQDSVLLAAVQPFLTKTKVIFYHHADYNLCLGVHLNGAIHVDPHNVGYYNCRDKENISDNSYLPLTVEDRQSTRIESEFIAKGGLITCSSGTFHKFRNFYLYPYSRLIVDRLALRTGLHYHIGQIPDHDLKMIRNALQERDVDPARFVNIPWTSSLWVTLIEKKIDLFIGSFPIGGARTTIEVMGAGIPILMPQNYLSRFFSSRDIVYPDAFLWKYPKDFLRVIDAVDRKSLAMHAARSRAHYILNYSPDTIDVKARIDRICEGLPTPAPYALYSHDPDYLDRTLHFSHLNYVATASAVHTALHGPPPSATPKKPALPDVGSERPRNASGPFSGAFKRLVEAFR